MSGGGVIDPKLTAHFTTFDHLLDGPKQLEEAIRRCKAAREKREAARKQGRLHTFEGGKQRVILVIGTNWSESCSELCKLLREDEVIANIIANHYEYLSLDIEGPFNIELNKEFGDPVLLGIPVVIILNEDGEVVTKTETSELEEDYEQRTVHFHAKFSRDTVRKLLNKFKYEEAKQDDVSSSSGSEED